MRDARTIEDYLLAVMASGMVDTKLAWADALRITASVCKRFGHVPAMRGQLGADLTADVFCVRCTNPVYDPGKR